MLENRLEIMSFRNIQGILDAKIGDPLAKLVLLVINHHAHKDTNKAFPSIETIAKLTGLSRRTVIRKLDVLVSKKLLIRIRQGRNQVNIYTIVKCQPDTVEVTDSPLSSDTVTPKPISNQPYKEKDHAGRIVQGQIISGTTKPDNYFTKRNRTNSSFFNGINTKLRGKTKSRF